MHERMICVSELEFIKEFSYNLKDAMREYDITQEELAEYSGFSQSTISRYLKGECMPSLKAICNLCCVFECEMSDLVPTDDFVL